MEERKKEEAEFHNEVRSRKLEEDINKHKYLTSNRKFYSVTRGSTRFVKSFLKRNCPERKVLDYCCGNGELTLFLAEYGAEATGIDISPVSIQNCKEKALDKQLEKNTNFLVMDAENLKFPDSYFDLIICSGVLHHLDIKKAYPELARILKPDGRIICDEPLIHNPIFQLYRKYTPHLRTEWETHHILSKNDVRLAKEYFEKVEKRFFHLAALSAVPFRNFTGFNFILSILEGIDSLLLRIPFLKWWAWQVVYILSKPKK